MLNKTVDLYSLGPTVFEMLNGMQPRNWKNADFNNGLNSAWNIKLSDEAKDFVSRLLLSNQTDRLSFDEFMAHKWLK